MINAIRQGSILDWLSRPIAAWIVLVISLCFTAFAWQLSDRSIEERAQDRFNADSQSIVKQIQDRMRDYEQVLRSGVGLFMSSHDVSRAEWHTYVEELNLAEVYPGMQAMGVSPKINAKDIQKHITSVRAEGFPAYNIYPLRESDAYYPVLYIEPFNERNQRAFGYDMFSHPVRRNAMTKAIDSGQPTLSGAITLVQESGQNIQRGFLYYLPVYKKNMPVDTVEQRRKAFDLFVYGAFRANDLIFGILSNAHPTLGIELFDGAQEAPSEIIYTNLPEQRFNTIAPVFRNDMHITVGGHQWVIRITSKPAFIATINKNQNYIILISGL